MAVAAVAAAVDHAVLRSGGKLKLPVLILVQSPQVILSVEEGFAACSLICLEFGVADGKKLSVFLRRHAGIDFSAGRDVAGEGEYSDFGLYDSVDDVRNFFHICFRYGAHDDALDACPVETSNLLQCQVEAAWLSEPVVCFSHSVERHLIFLTSAGFQHPADFIVEMKWIAHQGEGDIPGFQEYHQFPEIGMKDRIAAGDVEIWSSVIDFTEIFAVIHDRPHLLPGHTVKFLAAFAGENIAVLAALIAFISNMPLKRKIRIHPVHLPFLSFSYLSAALQAVPQTALFFSFLFHSAMLDNAMIVTS